MKITTKLSGAVAALTVGALALTACGGGSASPPAATDGTLNIGSWVEPNSFDPAQAQEGLYIPYYQAAYDSLILRAPDGDLEPMLATEWAYDDTNTTLTLALRDDVKFSDGEVFDSAAVKANLEHFKAANGPQASTMLALESVETPDARTAVLKLSEPDPAFLIYLTNAAGLMASPTSLEGDELTSAPVGSGPYLLESDSTVVGSQYTFTRNPDYWGSEFPYATIVFKYLPDATARLNALRSGQIDTTILSDQKGATEAKKSGLTFVPSDVNWQGLPLFDRGGAVTPALGDVRVRQALNYAIDRDGILDKILLGMGTATSQIWGKTSLGYVEELDSAYEYDPEKAKELLADAGYEDGFDLELPTVSIFDPSLKATIAQQLGDVGVRVTWTDIPVSDFFSTLLSAKYSATMMSYFEPNDWQLVNQFVSPEATWNPFKTEDETVATLSVEIQTGDESQRKAAAQELNQYIVDQAWFVPLFRPQSLLFTDAETTALPQVEQAAPSIYNYSPASGK
ncbi:ABC transporter substrate-binding protein [Microbacterium sp. PMB16]|uniref:ABC transporter substrate-binding protein n=1 Tax=Microbacterium sp. PMB16 TaxID=3120157 RepID=UPI003F4BFF40